MAATQRGSSPAAPVVIADCSQAEKPHRTLACILCQHRKVKCDRSFPCSNCIKFHVQCIPAATQPSRPRRRRFPERELLDRVRQYEKLLRDSNIDFEPLHKGHSKADQAPPNIDDQIHHDNLGREKVAVEQGSSPPVAIKEEVTYDVKDLWQAMSQKSQTTIPDSNDSDSSSNDELETIIKGSWKERYRNNDPLLFGSCERPIDVSTMHPEPFQVFKLWQIYLSNINPLLKVTHTPTLQTRIIDAIGNMTSVKPVLAALMFSIYCVAIMSLDEDQCWAMFASSKEDLLKRYQFSCQQALLNCDFLRTGDRDCLTALYLYLISVRPATDPQSLSSVLAVAIRTAQRMGIHNEAANTKCPALEAELRRRLWWSLILFDTRVCELADLKTAVLNPTWDCKTPSNLNDFDLQVDMKDPPPPQQSSEALFAVVRGEMGDFVRHSAFHLDFTCPALKEVSRKMQSGHATVGGDLNSLENIVEENHLKFCNSQNPLHFMTIWTARSHIAKNRMLEYYADLLNSSATQTAEKRSGVISNTFNMLECDTKLVSSPLTKGYLWFIHSYFPFPAYLYLLQDLRMRPISDYADQAWEVMSDNCEARFTFLGRDDTSLLRVFSRVVLQAWKAREDVSRRLGSPLAPPRIVSGMRLKLAQATQDTHSTCVNQNKDGFGMESSSSTSMPLSDNSDSLYYDLGGQSYAGDETGPYHNLFGKAGYDVDMTGFDWAEMDMSLFL